jgi:hypothetical protein
MKKKKQDKDAKTKRVKKRKDEEKRVKTGKLKVRKIKA